MTRIGYVGIFGVLVLSWAPSSASGQPAVAPASSIRVIEIVDPYSGDRDRRIADDLTAAEISRIQQALAAAGFDPGRATGQWNATTRLQLGRFQASRGLPQCECLTYVTLVALRIRPRVVASIRAPLAGAYGSRTIVLAPHSGRFLGHGHGPSVIVGHQPARGAGEIDRRSRFRGRAPHFPDRHDRDGGHLDPRPSRPRPESSVSRSGAPLRSLSRRPTQP